MVVSIRIVTLFTIFAVGSATIMEMFKNSPNSSVCTKDIKETLTGPYPMLLTVLVVLGPLLSLVLVVINIVIMLNIKKTIVAETDQAVQKCFEVMDNVLVELMPTKVQTTLQTAIEGKPASGKDKDNSKESNEASVVSQVNTKK
ncbi:hypothetical protein PFISCL1PPCAC_25020, partial [Pristionchus fissidentatus]